MPDEYDRDWTDELLDLIGGEFSDPYADPFYQDNDW